MEQEELSRTSKEWQRIMPEITVIDPDGWDRENYDFSWNQEIITRDEYIKRRTNSTCYGFVEESESLGWDVIQFTKKYEGTDKYDDIMLAIEFGYQSALKYEKVGQLCSKEEVIDLLEHVRNNYYDTGDFWHKQPDQDLTSEEVFNEYKKQL